MPQFGPELLTNTDFATDTVWTKGTGWTIAGGQALSTATGQSNLSQAGVALEAGATYGVSFDLSRTSGSARAGFSVGTGVLSSAVFSSTRIYVEMTANASNSTFYFRAETGGFVGSVDNVSLRKKLNTIPSLHAEGDSFMGGSGTDNVLLPMTIAGLMNRLVTNTGVGGSTMTQIRDRLIANTTLQPLTTIIWDGDQNGITTVPAYCDLLQQGLTALGHTRFIVIPACVNNGQVNVTVEVAIRDEFLVRWPNNTLDWRNFLTLDGSGNPTAAMYVSGDSTHLSQAAMDLMGPAIKNFIEARGW